ncbi:LOW QUALITY PROTEIN: ATP synthase mitochondrial F1 complex assembly factor 1 [Lethenteron reissneri]|uniref:LOW QUALITY PROTEIN: ATP synthase mitochondrial F1 complex assembly factor 1 n=1 Tax=Lethenteron reissneri TaxID=7753 RepID=UPI002AB7BEEA|nr:LOW QUALITY PROTEIN: ATP synthase mitochondrial F1 complex assembly factor 1 [Lethenteron reissneri]
MAASSLCWAPGRLCRVRLRPSPSPLALGVPCGAVRSFFLPSTTNSNNLRASSLPTNNNQPHDSASSIEGNPFYGKYAARIEALRRNRPDDFNARLQRLEQMREAKEEAPKQEGTTQRGEKSNEFSRESKAHSGKGLDSIIKIELIQDKTPHEIEEIWTLYFSNKNVISAVIPGDTYDLMSSRGKECPTFVYAVPREHGHEMFMGQWASNSIHFTSLINFQTRGDLAESQLVIQHYTELRESKGLVLMVSETLGETLSSLEARCLASQVQIFYADPGPESKFSLVRRLNQNPSDFDHMTLLAALRQQGILGIGGQMGGAVPANHE